MLKTLALGILTLAFSFFVGASYINAQEATNTPTPTEEPTTETTTESTDDSSDSDDLPEAAPKTGFGF